MVRLTQVKFRYGTLPVVIVWAKMFLIPKGKGEYRGIGLVEVLWKVFSVMVNFQLKRSVVLHGTLHGCITVRGMGTAKLEKNLAQKLEGIARKPIFQVFLDVQKAYDLLDWER